MKKNKRYKTAIHKRFSPWAWLGLILLMGVLMSLNYAGNKMLNPTEDGIILAQSWRIIQGEVPHIDFISNFPIGSSILHSVHFLSPFPLKISARYFALFQFFIIAFSWVQFFRLKSSFKHEVPIAYQISILLIAWMFGTYNFNLFSWVSIDAIFWASLGFYFTERAFHIRRSWTGIALGLFAFSMAALSKQSFILVFIFAILWIASRVIQTKKYKSVIIAFPIGLIPFIAYAILITANNAWEAFISQISGQSDFYNTGIKTYLLRFKSSEILWVNIGVILLAIFGGIAKTTSHKARAFFASLPSLRMVFVIETGLILYFFHQTITYFLGNQNESHLLPFLAFWILLDMFLLYITIQEHKLRNCLPTWAALIVAWVASIGNECNSPVFAFGILTTAIIWLYLQKYQDALLLKQKWLRLLFPSLAIFIIIITINSQYTKNNCNLKKSEQTHVLSEIHPSFGNISTNENSFLYFQEIDSLIHTFQKNQERFVFLPDNAIIYPIYRIKNPLPLDRIQANKVSIQTQGEVQYADCIQTNINEGVIFAVQKVNTKNMCKTLSTLNYNDYRFLNSITNECNLLFETHFFKIYKK